MASLIFFSPGMANKALRATIYLDLMLKKFTYAGAAMHFSFPLRLAASGVLEII